MKYYTIGNKEGKTLKITVPSGRHTQHCWDVSFIDVTFSTFQKIEKELGNLQWYTNPIGDFGQAVRVGVRLK
jgi:hypothetical protein